MASNNLTNNKSPQMDPVTAKRVDKYNHLVRKNPTLRNFLYISGDDKRMIFHGTRMKPSVVDGYIKFPGSNVLESLNCLEGISIALLPREKLIVNYKGKYIFRGYQKNGNTEDFMLILYVAGSTGDWLVLDLDQDDLPLLVCFSLDEVNESFNRITYDIVKNLLKQNTTVSLSDEAGIIVESEDDDDYDEFE